MLKNIERELVELGWTQLVQQNTNKKSNRNGTVSETLIDHVWTNGPVQVRRCGQEEMAASDHQLVWVKMSTKNLVDKVKRTLLRTSKWKILKSSAGFKNGIIKVVMNKLRTC